MPNCVPFAVGAMKAIGNKRVNKSRKAEHEKEMFEESEKSIQVQGT